MQVFKNSTRLYYRPAAGVSAAISTYAAASQVGTAPGAGSDVVHITEEERQRILEDEQRQLDQMKASAQYFFGLSVSSLIFIYYY